MVPACQGYLSMQIVSSEQGVTRVSFQSGSHRGIAPPPAELREGRERIAAVALEEHHRVEPEVRDLRHEVIAARLGEDRLAVFLAALPLTGLSRLGQEAGDVGAAVARRRPRGERPGQVAQ